MRQCTALRALYTSLPIEFFGPAKLSQRNAPSAKNPESHKLAPKKGKGKSASKAPGGGDAISPLSPRQLEITIPPTLTTDSKRYYNDPAPKRAPFVERLTMSTMTGDPDQDLDKTTAAAMVKRAAAPKG